MKKQRWLLVECCILACIATMPLTADVWTETTQDDFRDGIYERNIYASLRDGGAVEFVPAYDLNDDGYLELFTADYNGPNTRIYWSNGAMYSASNVTLFPITGGGNCDAADVNYDGYPDFIVTHPHELKLAIYWGSDTGPHPSYAQYISMGWDNGEACFVADLNKDGYLDIVIDRSVVGSGAVLWGSAAGYSFSNRTDVPVGYGQHNCEVADFNRDTWLDLLFNDNNGDLVYYGSASGYSASNVAILPVGSYPHGTSVADLDANGYLDVIITHSHDQRSFIYWGSATGFSASNYQTLHPQWTTYGGSAVADFDGDDYLDIVFFTGAYGVAYQRIFWGSATGYSDSDTSQIGVPIEATGGFVADFNDDGELDIFSNTVTPSSNSHIFWGPSFSTYQLLPVNRDHHGTFREFGNVYNRTYDEDYVSSVFDAVAVAAWGVIEWDEELPSGASIAMFVRSGDTPAPDMTWSEWCGVNNGDDIPASLDAQYIQYKAHMLYANPSRLPLLSEVRIAYEPCMVLEAGIQIRPKVIQLSSSGKFTCAITLPVGYDHELIDPSTVVCEGAQAQTGHSTAKAFLVKFEVNDLVGVNPGQAVVFTVTGQLYDGTPFSGYDIVRVIDPPELDVVFSPNPCKTTTVFTVQGGVGETVFTRVYDVSGALIRDVEIATQYDGTGTFVWDRKDRMGRQVPAGVYLVDVRSSTSRVVQKLIIVD